MESPSDIRLRPSDQEHTLRPIAPVVCRSRAADGGSRTRADPTRKAKIYTHLGLELVYQSSQHKVLVAVSSNQDHMGYGSVSEGRHQPHPNGR